MKINFSNRPSFLNYLISYESIIHLLFSLLIVGLLGSIAIHVYQTSVFQIRALEAYPMSYITRMNATEYYITHGVWPTHDVSDEVNKQEFSSLESIAYSGMTVHIKLGGEAGKQLKGRKITFRPAVSVENPTGPILWVCGNKELSSKWFVLGKNSTDVESKYLPHECRASPGFLSKTR